MVYFIESGGYLKVGYASDMKSRMKAYKTENPNPMEVIGVINGGFEKEKEIHQLLNAWHAHHEWFYFDDNVRVFVEDIIENNKDNVEPPKKIRKPRQDKTPGKLLSLIKNAADKDGELLISKELIQDLAYELNISVAKYYRIASGLIKENMLTRVGDKYLIP